jgi:hypothetical protein
MADDYALALQKALVGALNADAAVLAATGGRIYDEPPQNAVYPYLMIGDISPNAFDTDNTEGAEVQIGLEAYSQAATGRVEAVAIAEAVKAALHRQEGALSVTGFNVVEIIFQTYSASRSGTGRGYSSRISLQATLETNA